jgi:dienelactone hydrolase
MKNTGVASVVLATALLTLTVPAAAEDFRAAKVAWQMELYGGAEHGFSTPKNAAEERANTLSQAATVWFLSEIFGN